MPRYKVTLTPEEIEELERQIPKGGKGYRIKHAEILLKLDQSGDHTAWGYEQIMEAYHTSRGTIAGVAKRFVMEGMEAVVSGGMVYPGGKRRVRSKNGGCFVGV